MSAETTEDLYARIQVAEVKAQSGATARARRQDQGFVDGLRSCEAIALDRDAKAAELTELRVVLKLGPRESIGLAVRWLKEKQ
tara:strand:+ start:722 stop:970 length:249 start_codon:yes stop_codon:yes gene_type:complete